MAKLSAQEMAQQYGFAYAFLRSDASLWSLFTQAVAGNWAATKFQAELKNTSWYQKNAESVRQYQFLAKTDPATMAARKSAITAQMQDKARIMGATMSGPILATIANNALMFGWNDAQIQNVLAGYVKATNGVFSGNAADSATQIRQKAWRNGVSLSESTIQSYAQGVAAGNLTVDGITATIRNQAKSVAPAYAQELDSGMDLYDVASPYMQSMAKILEVAPASIDLFDPTIRSALSSKDAKGQATSKSLWQFEQGLRQDPRWTKTQNAQDSMMSTGRKVLNDFGFRN
jgi:hypothetical protein